MCVADVVVSITQHYPQFTDTWTRIFLFQLTSELLYMPWVSHNDHMWSDIIKWHSILTTAATCVPVENIQPANKSPKSDKLLSSRCGRFFQPPTQADL